ncbi:hypothetical protein BDV95DRAFT_578616 [Massariosphaeria phaeospora]|uniref:polynucleotide adenylyltransferase n=1 Tax=Massariosphaeria phaeospora TaxID=100035 RepID=A0A7C8M3K4_9PLEO|nr:hypothetical protein BDV95DRAFT_578616 [Massariosphaeria phaeospora]
MTASDETQYPTGPDKSNVLDSYPVLHQKTSSQLSEHSNLTSVLSARHMLPSEDESHGRKQALDLIKEVLLGSSDDATSSTSDVPMVIVPVGSYALGVWTTTSDIDCLCIGSISSKTFFKLARQRIRRAETQGVLLLRRVDASTGTVLRILVNGVNMDLQYCPAARIVERWSEIPNLSHDDPIFDLPIVSLRKLKPYRDYNHILRATPALSTFRLAYRCIKLWVTQRGIYSAKFGYLRGAHIALMLSWVCKRLANDLTTFAASDLVATFFHHYAHFDWDNSVVFDAFFHKKVPRYQRNAREPMVVLGLHAPNANVGHTTTVPALETLVNEFRTAEESLSSPKMTWQKFFGHPSTSPCASAFLHSHDSYVKIDIQFWGRTLAKGKSLVGWVESRCSPLIADIHKSAPNLTIRIWPARFTDRDITDSESEYHGCYLIGLSKRDQEPAHINKENKQLAQQALDKTLDDFQSMLQSEVKYYDASSSWIGVSLAKPSGVQHLRLDTREWGDDTAEIDDDSDSEDEFDLDDPSAPQPDDLSHHAASTHSSTPTPKLRPASDVLNRLRWDPNLDPANYIIGYEDRFLGAKEMALERWKTEQTDDEFIPQHRILYFKRKGDGVVVWERRGRVDRVFGSGIGAGILEGEGAL